MIISHKLKYVFIHVPKTAGTSIREFLYEHCEPDVIGHWRSITAEEIKNDDRITKELWTHSPAKDVKKYFEKHDYNWDEYFKFAFIRNPWDRGVSMYEYYRQILSKDKSLLKNHTDKNLIIENFVNKETSFLSYIKNKNAAALGNLWDSAKMLYNHDNNNTQKHLLVDFVGKFENINYDMRTILKKIKPEISSSFTIPHVNNTKRNSYKSYYDEEAIELIRSHNEVSIELGGYNF